MLGLVAALALRGPFRGRGFVRGSMLLPYVAPVVAVTFVWEIAAQPAVRHRQRVRHQVFGWDEPVAFLSSARPKSLLGIEFTCRWPC